MKRKDKTITQRIIYTVALIFITRLLTSVPILGINKEAMRTFLGETNEMYNLFNMFSGGALANMSMFSLSISPYISASIIVQLLGTMSSKMERIAQDGEAGRKRIEKLTNIISIVIAIMTSITITKGLRSAHALPEGYIYTITTTATLILGTVILMIIGEKITDNGVGNGISLILTMNILSQTPRDLFVIYHEFVLNSKLQIASGIIVITFILLIIFLTIRVHEVERRVPLIFSGKLKGKTFMAGETACLPIKLSPGGVTPVIFVTTIMAFPSMLNSLFNFKNQKFVNYIIEAFNPNNWFKINNLKLSLGFIVYATLLVAFAYMYANVAINTKEMANTLKLQHATIPNIRQGKETEWYLERIIKGTTLLGALSLLIICMIPIMLTNYIGVPVSFGGTSIIIIVSVLTELAEQIRIEREVEKNNKFSF